MKKILILLLNIIFVLTLHAQQQNFRFSDIKLIESNDNYLILEFYPKYDSVKTISYGADNFSVLKFLNGRVQGASFSGYPDVNFRNITVGLPSTQGNTVEVLSGDYESIANFDLAPVPGMIKTDDSIGVGSSYLKNENIYGKNQFYPENITELTDVGIAREYILGSLKIFPLQYNPVTKELRKYSKIRVRVNFGLTKSVTSKINSIGSGSGVIKDLVINFNQALSWIYTPSVKRLNAVKNSVLNSGTWYKLEVKEDGIYKLDANFFKNAGISLSGVDPRSVKIYGNGGAELPENPETETPEDLVECAIFASGETDGTFNDTDYFMFYGQSPHTWVYDSRQKKYRHFINHYSNSNYYFLTFGGSDRGKRVTTFASGTSSTPVVANSLSAKTFIEPEKVNMHNSGKQWYGVKLDPQFPSAVYLSDKLEGFITGEDVLYRFVVGAASYDRSFFKIEQNGELVGNIYVDIPVDYVNSYNKLAMSDTVSLTHKSKLSDGKMNLKVTYNPNQSSDYAYFDWMEAFYKRSLSTTSDEIKFNTPDESSFIEYNLSGYSNSNITVFDVTDHNNVKTLSNGNISAGTIKFQLKANQGAISEIFVVGNNGTKSPASVVKISNSNLHGESEGALCILISPNDQNFLTEAARYKAFRESSKINPVKTIVVNLDQIYNEFSSGKQDPSAVRNFLRYAYLNWKNKPKYVLLFGDGSFDFKNILNKSNFTELNRIPVYEVAESNHEVDSYTSDDYFARIIGNDNRNELGIGRITAITSKDARVAIDKIIAYENSPMDSWRNVLTFVADDGISPNLDEGSVHTSDCDNLAEVYTPAQFNKNKIYIVSYKTVVTSAGRTKPDANIDIIKSINNGTLLLSYFGHGNPGLWAHESIMRNATTIPALTNKNKLCFVLAATCDFGKFDNPGEQSGTELFLLKENGGAIGVFSASRSVYGVLNYAINREFLTQIFSRNDTGSFPSLGDVMYFVKQEFFSTNDSKFHLFGDPCIVLSAPNLISEIDSINNIAATYTIQLKAQGKVNLKGYVKGVNSEINKSYNGKMQLTVYDAPKRVEIYEGAGYFSFDLPGGIIYSGECTIKNGRFEAGFIVPKDISYENRNGKVSMYFYNTDKDGYGYNSNILISGTDTTGATDEIGPVTNIYLNDRNFRNGDLVGQNPLLIVDLYDESGINTTGLGVGHQFEAFLNNSQEGIALNSYYKGKTDSYTEGTAEYRLSNLPDGNHKLKIKVFDVFNNPSNSEVTFKVQNTQSLSIMNVMNFPNPFSKTTKFTMQQNQDEPIDVTIKVFTVAGRLIKVINEYGITSKFVQIEWDGRDEDGDEIANGVYLYKVISKTRDGKFTSEALGKLSVLK